MAYSKRYRALLCHNEGLPLAFGLVVIVQLGAIIFGQASFPISEAGEDGSFYLQVAHNLVVFGFPTFDGFAPTTGVHWGWLFLLAAIYKLIPTNDPETMFRLAAIAYFLLLAGTGLIVVRITRSWALGLFLVVYLANRGHWYMETHLVLFTLALAIRAPNAITGFLLVAARTDMVLFALFTRQWNVAMGAILGFIWVCIVNMVVDGNPISVSAQIKSAGFNDLETIVRTMGHLSKYYFPVLEITCMLALLSPDRWFLAGVGLLAIHILHNSETQGWYLAPLFLTSLLCAYHVVCRTIDAFRYYGRPLGVREIY